MVNVVSMIEERLKMAVANPSHAYVIEGGEEAKILARDFAKSLQCECPQENGPCLSCRVFESGNHPDVVFVRAMKTKAIGVDDVRAQIVVPMGEKPFRYRYKVFVVDQVMTAQAQNALLKTIEEPASFGIFIFVTESLELYLPTVLSRCVVLKMGRGLAEDEEMMVFARSVADRIEGLDVVGVFGLCGEFDRWKESIQTVLDMLYLCFRERLNGADTTGIMRLEAVAAAKKALAQNGNFQMVVETMLMRMRTWK